MRVKSETVYDDGSGWMAVVEIRGIAFCASHVNGKVSSGLAGYKHPPRFPRWVGPYLQKWAEKRVAELPADYHAKHREIYGVAA